MNSKKYAIFLDLDGTLWSDGFIPDKNIEAIAQVQSQGHKVFLNTGRSYACVPKSVFEAINFDGFVLGIGSHVEIDDEVLHRDTFPQEQLVKITDHFLATGRKCTIEGVYDLFYLNVKAKADRIIIKSGQDFIDKYKNVPISKVTAEGILTDEDIELLEENFMVLQHEHYAEFAVKGNSKSKGMKLLLERLSISKENCIAMGDSINDIDMLEYAGISIAMGNATDEVKRLCDHITDTAENAGVAIALEKYILSDEISPN